jgi:hypothetical protein
MAASAANGAANLTEFYAAMGHIKWQHYILY